jgi:hypothetical protein
MTNLTATFDTEQKITFEFDIQGGASGATADIFAAPAIETTNTVTAPITTITNLLWTWKGQGYTCNRYALTNMPKTEAFFVLGTSQDSDGDGITDAYEKLVNHTDPNNPASSDDGLSDYYRWLHNLKTARTTPSLNSITVQTCPIN